MSAREQADAIALAADRPPHPDNGPRYVVLRHRQDGIGTETLEHRVEIRDTEGGLLAEYPAHWAARWLEVRGYTSLAPFNGLWSRP